MPAQAGTIETLAIELGTLFSPLRDDLTPDGARGLFLQLGIPLTDAQISSISGPMNTVVSGIEDLFADVTAILAAIETADYAAIIQKGLDAITKIKNVINGIKALATAVGAMSIPGVSPDVLASIADQIFNYLLAKYLDRTKALNEVLEFMGILERVDNNVDSTDPTKPEVTVSTYHFDRISNWLTNPVTMLQTLYDWGSPAFDGKKLFPVIEKILARVGLPVLYDDTVSPALIDLVVLEITPDTTVTPVGIDIKLKTTVSPGPVSFSEDPFKLDLKVDFQTPTNTGLLIQPNGNIVFTPPSSASAFGGDFMATLTIQRQNPPDPFLIFGQTNASRLEIASFVLGTGVTVAWDGSKATGDFQFQLGINGGKVIIDTSKSDGFLSKILPGTNVNANVDMIIGVSSARGLYFGGSSALEIRLPAHIELGPISVEGLTITVKIADGSIPISLGADIKAALGPMTAIVQNMGITSTFSFPSGGGNLGPLQLDLGFKPPDGVGLSLDSGVIQGGGFLKLDFDKGEYFGALELSFQGIISLKAIGIINTKMPDGSKGFALLILITAEFTPIQLGFGFTLNGVGGLIAVNRSTDIDALKAGVKSGAIESVLFPEDIVANITRIISDLKTIFPIVEGHFLLGPMAKLGWGTPTLITVELGVIIDIPVPRLIILGVLKCILPSEDAPILALQVNFDGGIDFDQGLLWFDASLFDSHLLIYTLTGDMALRIGWKDPMFILSMGGFHPAFHDIPPDLTNMKRIGISLFSGDNPRLSCMTYFAVTSNSVQSGAKVELYAEAAGFNIYGFLGYDLLVQFSPFHFDADIYAGLALRSGTDTIAGISVHCELSGPSPWNANGDASLSFLFFSIDIGFNVTWGDNGPPQPVDTVDVLALVLTAIADDRNWKADLPANTNQSVTLKKITLPEGTIIVHPFGELGVSQKIVPLDLTINKFGNDKPGPDTFFAMTYAGGPTTNNTEEFAIANFLVLSDSDKLAKHSFDPLKSGLSFQAANGAVYGSFIDKEVNYELSYVRRSTGVTIKGGRFRLFANLFDTMVQGAAPSKSKFSVSKTIANNAPAVVTLPIAQFMVVNTADLSLVHVDSVADTQTAAYHLHDQLILSNPALQGNIQVLAAYELN